MISEKSYNSIIRNIIDSGGMTEDMTRDMERLKDELDERNGMLRRYGEITDNEDGGAIFTAKDGGENWRGKYEEMRKRYYDRFFGDDETEKTVVDDDIPTSYERENITITDLLYK